jgi:telomere length regulation protein
MKDTIVSELVQSMAATEKASPSILHAIISKLKPFEIRAILSSLLRYMNSQALLRSSMSRDARKVDDSYVRTAAAFFGPLVAENPSISRLFIEVITSPERAGVYCSTVLLRSVYAAISTYDEEVQNVLDISFEKFADELFIKHAPVIQQESNAQVLLLSAGHAKRSSPLLLRGHARSSQYLNAVSKHLSSNSTRVRWLGMIVGTAISGLVDKAETRMTFGDEILDSGEAKWYLNLTSVNDEPVKNLDFHALFWTQSQQEIPTSKSVNLALRQKISTPSAPTKSVSRKHEIPKSSKIVELSGDSEDADLVLYSKPDSDPEDDDEDPTLINRDKPRPPVYIRDLLTGLRDSEDYDRHRIALATAAPLIRRKFGFGKEVSDHAEELVTVLMNLNDQFEMEDFADMRHEALVAIMLADPQNVAELMVASLFDSDYSLQQRTSILTALGLGARELAGYDNDSNVVPAFPSKQLPIHLHRIYSDTPRQLTTVTSKLQQSIMEPLALEAADKITGPNALKVRTFSSRMEVEKKKKKPVPNALSRIVTDKIFFPLTGRWWIAKASNPHSPFLSGHLLPTYLRTLAIILHASGPFALSLPQITAELWDLLLAVRSSSLSNQEYGVLEALLFAFLMLLEVNENKERLAREHPRELVETQEWARMVLEVIRSGDEEGEKIRALAASVITRCHEVVEKWQRLMVGDMIDL